jgi:hypothetical protein
MIVNPQTLDNYYFGGDQWADGFTRYLAKLELVMLSKGHTRTLRTWRHNFQHCH